MPIKPVRYDQEQPSADELEFPPLEFLLPRYTQRIQKARAPRPIHKILRYALPAIALVLLVSLVVWPLVSHTKFAGIVLKNLPDIVVQNPRYTGLDDKDQPYVLSAAVARRPGGMPTIYDLEKPQGELMLKSGNWLFGKADYGRFDQETRKLWLGGNVQLFHDKGMQFTSDETQVDIDGNFAWSEKPVLIQGGFGEVRGAGFRLLDDGHTMIVSGPAKAILNLHPATGSDKPVSVAKP